MSILEGEYGNGVKAMNNNYIDGATLKAQVEWLKAEDCGCYHKRVGDTETKEIDIVVGWHDTGDGYQIGWKIGMQSFNNGMQCDMDIDFDMPYDETTGEVYDTLELIEGDIAAIDWDALAKRINITAAKAYRWRKGYEEYDKANAA